MTELEMIEQLQKQEVKISSMLCFALYASSRTAIDLYRPALEAVDLTYPQYLVMILLWEKAPRTVKNIGKALYLDSGTLSPLLKRLEKKGLITRQRDGQDERQVNIGLTPAGLALQEQLAGLPMKLLCQNGLPPEDYRPLIGQLQRLTDFMNSLQAETMPVASL